MSWRIPVTRGALLLMEAMWTYAFVAFFVAAVAQGGKPSFLAVSLVVFLSYGISRFLQSSNISLGALRAWGAGLSFLLFYTIVRIDFFGNLRLWDLGWASQLLNHTERTLSARVDADFGIILLWFAWVRGVLRGQDHLAWEDVLGTFGVGVLIVAFVEVFQSSVSDSPALVGQIAIPFGAVGLLSIGLAHAGRAGLDPRRSFSFTWITAVGGAVALLAAVAVLFALFNLGTVSTGTQDASTRLANLAGTILYYVFWPLAQLTGLAYIATRWLFDLFGLHARDQPVNTDATQGQTCEQLKVAAGTSLEEARRLCVETAKQLPDWVRLIVRMLVALPIVALLLAATAFFFRRFQKRAGVGDTKESTYREGRLAQDLSGLLGNLLSRLRPSIRFGREQLDPVRRLYFEMLDTADGRGIRRRPPQTPLELAPSLENGFRSSAPGPITDAFDDVRYGERIVTAEEVRRLRLEWEEIKRGRASP